MTRVLSVITHNWPLKVAAVVLASLLYVGLVLAQNSKEWRGQILIDVRNQPGQAVLIGGVQYVTSIRYFAPVDVASRITSDTFKAWIDLSSATPDASNDIVVKVNVSSPDPQVQVLDWSPRQISVRLDPLTSKFVPVQVDQGVRPPGLQVNPPFVDTQQVTVSGTQSAVSQVVAALARVRIDPSGVNVDQQVDLIPIDIRGLEVGQVRLQPSSVHVTILVGNQLTSRPLPINALVTGTPAIGFELKGVTIDTPTVTLEGDADILARRWSRSTPSHCPSAVPRPTCRGPSASCCRTASTCSACPRSASPRPSRRPRRRARSAWPSSCPAPRPIGAMPSRPTRSSSRSAAIRRRWPASRARPSSRRPTSTGSARGRTSSASRSRLPAGTTLLSISPAKVTVTITVPEPPSPSPSPSASPSPSP